MLNATKDGDIWRLTDNNKNSLSYKKSFIFDFTYIKSEKIKNIIKSYVWRNYIERTLLVKTLYSTNLHFKYFSMFAELHNISSLELLDNKDISNFMSFLKTTLSIKTKTPLSYLYQKDCLVSLKVVLHWGQLHIPSELPTKEIFEGNEFIGVNSKPRIDFIPDDVMRQINLALKNEQNPYLKYGIIILQSTGMRISDMLKLKINCLKPHAISGWTLAWYDHKKKKFREPMPIHEVCANAIQMIMDVTNNSRCEADNDVKDYLFIRLQKGDEI